MVQLLISSSLLILIVMLLRQCLGKRISLRLRYALWGLVLLRLLIPVTPIQSPLSVMNLFRDEVPAAVREVLLSFGGTRETWETEDTAQVGSDDASAWAVSPVALAGGVWLTVSAMLLYRQGRSVARFGKQLRETAVRLEQPDSPLPVYLAPGLSSPCLYGLLRPSVYLNWTAYESEERRAHAVAHELCHFRHLDQLWAVLREICLCLWWFHPLVWAAAYLSRLDCELACDEEVLCRLGEEQRTAYGRTLIALAAAQNHLRVPGYAPPMTYETSMIKERIHLMIEHPKNKRTAVLLAVLGAALAAGCTFTSALDLRENPEIQQVIRVSDPLEISSSLTVIPAPALTFGWPVEAKQLNGLTLSALYDAPRHNGLDITWEGCAGSPVLAACEGTVSAAVSYSPKYGNYVMINHKNGAATLYAHLKEISVQEGDKVKLGDQIGTIGSTGPATGPHLHFELLLDGEPADPMEVLPAREKDKEQDNAQANIESAASKEDTSPEQVEFYRLISSSEIGSASASDTRTDTVVYQQIRSSEIRSASGRDIGVDRTVYELRPSGQSTYISEATHEKPSVSEQGEFLYWKY